MKRIVQKNPRASQEEFVLALENRRLSEQFDVAKYALDRIAAWSDDPVGEPVSADIARVALQAIRDLGSKGRTLAVKGRRR